MKKLDEKLCEKIKYALSNSWSIESSTKWSKENIAKGQCGVTTLVVHDLLGGEILKTKLLDDWHFYNSINGKRYDFTDSQFKGAIEYMDAPSNREEAYLDTNETKYSYLKQKVLNILEQLL
ncbi:YunG family protein [Psychrobacillus sp. FSL K6-1267]|uniref:YunG family protein n=1 Tax=Psychrobacillus sp. FSL K6-1267 TaxID=2921543 RepID=UPI0030F728DC